MHRFHWGADQGELEEIGRGLPLREISASSERSGVTKVVEVAAAVGCFSVQASGSAPLYHDVMSAKTPAVTSSPPARISGTRLPWGTISRDLLVDAAMKKIRHGGYEQLSVRGLAAELGVGTMSLYRHVRDKDDLLDEVVDRLLSRAWRPRAS